MMTEVAVPYIERRASESALRDLWLEDLRAVRNIELRPLRLLLERTGPDERLEEVCAEQRYRDTRAYRLETEQHRIAMQRADRAAGTLVLKTRSGSEQRLTRLRSSTTRIGLRAPSAIARPRLARSR